MVKRRASRKKAAKSAAKTNAKRKKTSAAAPTVKRRQKTSLTQLVRQQEALEAEIDLLEQTIFAYETDYLSHPLTGNVVRGYAALLTSQATTAIEHVAVDDRERIFTKAQQ